MPSLSLLDRKSALNGLVSATPLPCAAAGTSPISSVALAAEVAVYAESETEARATAAAQLRIRGLKVA
jgi:hypothetical protein